MNGKLMGKVYYVDSFVEVTGDGSKESPFKTINEAAQVAVAGDEVIVADGEYREKITPKYSGTEENHIVYRSMNARGAIITGAEKLGPWTKNKNDVWTATIDNDILGDYNPYTTLVSGDWFIQKGISHTGDVFLNHKSLYETENKEQVFDRVENKSSWDHEGAKKVWFSEQKNNQTVFYAYFGDVNPNEENVEISVRQNCFMPEENGINYIEVRDFIIREAACQWAPPTAYQDGMIGPHWSLGWIIDNCEIYEAKCSGISLGKYLQPENDNKWLKLKYKDGTQTERDCICQAANEGWSKETVGSHKVSNCYIHDCGQTGIVGHMGGVFSVIEDNHIERINIKKNLAGAEIAGIKMHAAIDTVIRNNHIHHCTMGIWLDWQAQGTRVTGNFLHHNFAEIDISTATKKDLMVGGFGFGQDVFVEVSHGPTMIDNNYLLSERSLKLAAQGIAVVNNFIAGAIVCVGTGTDNGTTKNVPSPRYTPYHVPHGTLVAGFMTILHGDVHFHNNIFVQHKLSKGIDGFNRALKFASLFNNQVFAWDTNNFDCGTAVYDDYKTFEEWDAQFEGYCGMGSPQSDRYYTSLPVWIDNNFYFNGATPWKKEKNSYVDNTHSISVQVTWDDKANQVDAVCSRDGWQFITDAYKYVDRDKFITVTSDDLGKAFESEMRYEAPDGSTLVF